MTSHKTLHPSPRPTTATSLAAAAKHVEPKTSYLVHETTNAVTVARDGMIVQPALHNAPQPTGRFAKWPVHAFTQFCFDRLERGTHAFGHRMPMDREPAVLSRLATLVREAKEIESFRPALTASFTSVDRIAAELDQTRFSLRAASSQIWRTARGVLPDTPLLHSGSRIRSRSHPHSVLRSHRRGSGGSATTRSTGQTHSAGTRWKVTVRSPILAVRLRWSLTIRLLHSRRREAICVSVEECVDHRFGAPKT